MQHLHEVYVDCLIKEISMYQHVLQEHMIKTVYIGGGTPTCLSDHLLEKLMLNVMCMMKMDENVEVSIESNPGTLTQSNLALLRKNGVNRLSIGLQTLDDEMLSCLGRIHTAEQFIDNYQIARREGFNNINIDLMFSLPGQTLKNWRDTIEKIVALNPAHLSCYSLKIEENTPFYKDYQAKRFEIPDDETDRQMYEVIKQVLNPKGYKHYEISNFAKPGFCCHHNRVYWKGNPYIGIGAGSHSFMDNNRYVNEALPIKYIEKIKARISPIIEKRQISKHEKMSDFIILGLRLIEGVNDKEFYTRFHQSVEETFPGKVDKYIKMGLMEKKEGYFYLTARGIDVSNQIFIDFL